MYTLSVVFHDSKIGTFWRSIIWRYYATSKAASDELHRFIEKYDGQRVCVADWEISKTEE